MRNGPPDRWLAKEEACKGTKGGRFFTEKEDIADVRGSMLTSGMPSSSSNAGKVHDALIVRPRSGQQVVIVVRRRTGKVVGIGVATRPAIVVLPIGVLGLKAAFAACLHHSALDRPIGVSGGGCVGNPLALPPI